MSLPTFSFSSISAGARYLTVAGAGVIGTLATLHIVSGGDASALQGAINQIGDGVAKIAAGVSTIAGIGAAYYGAMRAGPKAQVASVAALPQVATVKMTTPEAAASVQALNVVGPGA